MGVIAIDQVEQPAGRREERALPQLLFVIPAYNEEANIPTLLVDLRQTLGLLGAGSKIFIVDDGSVDATADLVRAYDGPLPVELVQLEENAGPGAAFRTGFSTALEAAGERGLVVTLEADTTSDLEALPEMIAAIRGGADVVLADWAMVNVSAHRRALSAAAGWVVRRALGLEAKTVSSFFRVYRASTLREASSKHGDQLIRETGFACKAEILAKLAAMGASIAEVQVALDWNKRSGKSKMPVLRTMLAYWRMLFRERAQPQEALGS